MQNDLYPRWFNKLPAKKRLVSFASDNPYPMLLAGLLLFLLGFWFFSSLLTWFNLSVLADEDTMRSCLQEVAGPESTTNLDDATNQAYLKEVAHSALLTALTVLLLTISLAFTILKLRKK